MADGVKGKETMRRLPILFSVLALLLMSLFATSRGDPAIAPDGSEFTGAWQVTATRDDGVIIRSITALGAGGVAITVGLPAQPAPPGGDPGLLFLSTAVGAWEKTGADTANVTFIHIRSNAEGQPAGTVTVRLNITIDPTQGSDVFNGPAVATLADADGNVQAEFVSTVQGTRMRAEAPVLPDLVSPEA
jgi:hypothetical protein